MGVPIQPKGEKGWFMLPQAPEQAGSRCMGTLAGCRVPDIWRNTPTRT